MRVDFHSHIFAPSLRSNRQTSLQHDSTLRAMYGSPKARMASAEELVEDMTEASIDVAVVMGVGWTDPYLARESNDYIIESVNRYPQKLVGFCSINPDWGEKALDEVKRCASLGLKGIGEIHSDYQGFDIGNLDLMNPLMEVARNLQMPILIHSSEPVGHQYAGKGHTTPDKLYQFILNFPNNLIVCAHWGGGLPFYALMPEVSKALRNVYFDTSASPFLYRFEVFSEVARLVTPQKILFASDYPLLGYQRYFKDIENASLSSGDMELIMGGNAVDLLRL